ncbi:hypothetical protein BOX15_Mlig016808g2 [Macrostomum lignano]|uniref:Mab-21-like HhH/H2TH-like domain-containing protein n=1 Tax=Macrostomum lignano TaxID=282301 RepID=A0A267DFD2_9PLAT|nr:hypothetical protein BOX15_Mlig016808g2 [Macrostomum lignano]
MPLHLACRDGHLEAARLLLEALGSPSLIGHPDKSNMTPLHTAVMRGHAAIVRLLLRHGANPDASNAENLTPIELAARSGLLESLKCLLPYLKRSSKLTLGAVLRLASAFGHIECCKELLMQCSKEEAVSALLSLPQTFSVQGLVRLLDNEQMLTLITEAEMCSDGFNSVSVLVEALERAGFNQERMQCLQVRAKVQQAILRCQFADSADWSGFEAHLVGSYSDGCGNSIVSADGSTDLESDIDVLLLDKTREPIHIASFCRCPTVSDSSKMAYEDGHVTISGVTSNPTKYYGPSHLKPSMDMVAAQICCCYPTIFLLDNARYFPENVLQALKIEIDRPQSCHVVSAAAPGRRGRQKRISTAFLENIVMKSLNTVQCWFFVTLKYIVKHAICTSTSTFGLKTYHVKTLLFQALDATPPECWQKENLRPLLLKSLTELESALKAVQPGDLKLMKHFFLPEAALYLKESSCAASIAESTTKVINSLDKVLNEFALMLRPQVGDEKIIYNPLLHFSLSFCRLNLVKPEDGTASESLPAHSAAIYNATVAVTRCMEILSTDESSKTDDEFAEAMALTETIGDFAIAAKVCLRVLLLLRRSQRDNAREELLHFLTSCSEPDWSSSGRLDPEHCRTATELSQQLLRKNYIAKFCCRLDDEYKIDTDKLVLREFNSNIFPVHLSNHINAFYMNFNALAVYLAKILLPGQCNLPIIEDTTRLAEDPSADPQEIYLALIFGQDVDRLVGIAHRHRSVIGREPELQRAMRDRLFKDSTVGTRFLEVSIEKTCCQLLSKCKKSQH